jgi:hypothetical protein
MTDAFARVFPGAPTKGLVEANAGSNWAAAKAKPATLVQTREGSESCT